MLDRLNAVPWDTLATVYQRGSDLPKLLKKLTSRSESVRQQAMFDLREELLHQGHVMPEAAAAVAPFLMEFVQAPKMSERAAALRMLADMAAWGSTFHYLTGAVGEPFRDLIASVIDPHPQAWRSLLRDADPRVVAATTAVVAFASSGGDWVEPLSQLASSGDPLVRCSALLALHVLGKRGVNVEAAPFAAAMSSSDRLVESAALIGLTRADPSRLDDEAFLQAAELAEPRPPVEGLPWGDGHLDHLVAQAVSAVALAAQRLDVVWLFIDARSGALLGSHELAAELVARQNRALGRPAPASRRRPRTGGTRAPG